MFTDTEVWRDIPDYEGLYKASNMGKILSLISGVLLNPYNKKDRYLKVSLYKKGKEKIISVHRIIAITFLGNQSPLVVDHIDGNKTNNALYNLEWVTNKENSRRYFASILRNKNQLEIF